AAVDRLIEQTPPGPEWISVAAKIEARRGRTPRVKQLLDTMAKTGSDVTTGSSTNAIPRATQCTLTLVRGEIALAEHQPADAVATFEAARLVDARLPSTLESLPAPTRSNGTKSSVSGGSAAKVSDASLSQNSNLARTLEARGGATAVPEKSPAKL